VLGAVLSADLKIQRAGFFAKARNSDMNLAAVGQQLATQKAKLDSSLDALKALSRAKDAGKKLITRVTSSLQRRCEL
jgi:hypothetical protein